MTGRLLLRGMFAGIAAGCLSVGFGEIFGEPQIALALAFEAARDAAAGAAAQPEIVSRAVQRGIGLLTAAVMYGAGLGGLFSLAFAVAYGRIGRMAPRPLALLLAAAGFLAIVLVPDLKYPPNPPAVGAAATIGIRTALYFEMVAIALASLTLAVLAGRGLTRRLGPWNATLAAALLFAVVVAAVQRALPDINEVPADFPAVALWRFRLAAIGMQLVLWGALGLSFGALADRLLSPKPARGSLADLRV